MAGLDPATQGCCAHIFTGFDHAACAFQAAILGGRVKPGHDEFYLVAASPAMTKFMPWQRTGHDEIDVAVSMTAVDARHCLVSAAVLFFAGIARVFFRAPTARGQIS
jgi:hypothetical protein